MVASIALIIICMPVSYAQEPDKADLPALEKALRSVVPDASPARQRLAVRRVIRDAEKVLEAMAADSERWALLEFLFRARQVLVKLDTDPKHRQALIETSRELVKAPDEFASLRMEADLLLSQAELAKKGVSPSERSQALRPFVERYVDTSEGTKALRTAILMALELGDSRLVNDLRKIIAERYSNDLEMTSFLRDHLGGQVFGVPFFGHFERSDGKTVLYPMDGLGHSMMVLFWSKKEASTLQYLADIAHAYNNDTAQVDGRLEIVSINLDELPDAGESIIRRLGADWQCLHFPGGRDNPMYRAYARVDPLNMRVAPTGQTAVMMRESRPKPPPLTAEEVEQVLSEIKPNPEIKRQTEWFRRTLIRSWSQDDYALHLSALMSGDFLIFDPEGELDPVRPPELKAAVKGGAVTPLQRTAKSVPEATLREIQNCLIPPPQRYHSSVAEIRAAYERMRELCRKTIGEHPDAPDLWIIRNRLIIALLGLWKTDFELKHFEAAVAESKAAMEAGYPEGTDVIARFCLARQALRDPAADAGAVIDNFVAGYGGKSVPGPVLAAASLLSLDVADADRYEKFRKDILIAHTEYPMMWLYSSFLLSRYHDYWMFHVPFTAGWSYGRRLRNSMSDGRVEEAHRMLKLELPTLDGKVFRIPEDLETEYTVILLAQPQPWKGREREDPNPPSPSSVLRQLPYFVVSRPDVDLLVAMLGDEDAAAIRENIQIRNSEEQLDGPILRIPGGMHDPLIHRLGLLDDESGMVMLDKQGRILDTLSATAIGNIASVVPNTIQQLDEADVMDYLRQGNVQAAKELIFSLAPPYDPEAVDERGRKLREPKYSLPHLRARAKVYMALEEWDQALEDAQKVYDSELGQAGGMSIRTDELDAAEAVLEEIRARIEATAP